MIEAPADLMAPEDWYEPDACKEESPAWGYEGEGQQCRRKLGHDGPHYTEGPDPVTGDQAIVQWEARP